MDERIEKILRTDAEARKRISKAKNSASLTMQESESEIESIRRQTEKKTKAKMENIAKQYKKNMIERENEKREKAGEIAKRIEEQYRENAGKWVDELFDRVISPQESQKR